MVSHRQFRILLALTLFNTIMLGGFVVGPVIGPMVRNKWTEYQYRRVQAAQLQRRKSATDRLMDYKLPAEQLVYDENPDRAASLYGSGPAWRYLSVAGNSVPYFIPHPWQPPAFFEDPSIETDIRNAHLGSGPFLFLHSRTNHAGRTDLIIVTVQTQQQSGGEPALDQPSRDYEIRTYRHLDAVPVGGSRRTRLEVDKYLNQSQVTWTRTDSWENGTVKIQPKNLFRFFAGQPDPNDPAHFTIAYDLDDKHGTIDGYFTDEDAVDLRPRAGRITDRSADGQRQTWNPHMLPPPTATTKSSP